MSALEEVGYVTVRKGYVGKRPRTWLSLTETGREAFGAHVDALREIVGQRTDGRVGRDRRHGRPA